MRILLVLLLSLYSFQSLSGQTKERDSILNVLQGYSSQYDSANMLKVSKEAQKKIKVNNESDSLYMARLLYYEAHSLNYSENAFNLRKLYDRIIAMCPTTHDGLVLKATTILNSTIRDNIEGFQITAYQKTQKALAIVESLNKPAPVGLSLTLNTDMAWFAFRLGETEKHNKYLLKAQQIFNQNKFEAAKVLDYHLSNIRFLIIENGKEKKIIDHLSKIKNLDNKSDEAMYVYKYAMAKIHVAEYYLKQFKSGDIEALHKANNFINDVLENSIDDHMMSYYKKWALHIRNEVLIEENKFKSALNSNTELINISNPKEGRMRLNLYQRLIILLKLNQFDVAEKELHKVINSFHNSSESLKSDYSNFKTFKKLEYVSLFLDLSDAFKKFENKNIKIRNAVVSLNKLGLSQFQNSVNNQLTTPKTRALLKRIIFNFISTKHYGLGYGMTTPEFLETIENLKHKLDWQKFLQNRAYAELPFINDYKYEEIALRDELVEAKKKKQDSIIIKLELQLDQLEKAFKEKHPNYSKLAFSDFNTTGFQSKLKEDEVVLKYELVKDSMYTFVISKNDVFLQNLGYSEHISTNVKKYIANISERVDTDQLSKQLYQQIIPKQVLAFNKINIVPDDYLFKLPFETLKNNAGNYLIEDKVVLYAPYLSLFQHNAITNTNDNEKRVANLMIFTPTYEGFANTNTEVAVRGNEYRLDGAEKESQLLANVFDNASFSNYSATKENFKAHAPNAKLLHLSMHADIDPITPELSYLLFTEGNADNKLYLEELYGMNLKANMAVLSACNTGSILKDNHKGMVSLHRAFTQAGVPTTVASLWNAPDYATQEIMVEFYKQLKDGKTKAKALQLAKLHYLKTTDDALLKAPFYWAGFIINGSDDTIITPQSNLNYLVWFLVALIIVISIYLIAKKFYAKKNV